MSKIKIKIEEGGCGCEPAPKQMPNVHNSEEARMHRTSLAHLVIDAEEILNMVQDGDRRK